MTRPSRREILGGLAASSTLGPALGAGEAEEKVSLKGNIKHSAVAWCFQSAGEKWSLEKLCEVARSLGCVSVELTPPSGWSTLKKYGLSCALAPNGMPGAPFMKGFNNPRYQEEVLERTRKTMDACAEAGVPAVIGFTGYRWRNAEDPKSGTISADEGAKNCIKGLKAIASYAEKKKVTLCIEHLNTRDDSHPMKGHPGYQGDDLDWLAGILRKVGSERVKLLFDVYHVQIMHGDLLRRLEQHQELLGHIHTAGNPGRGELDETQEINYIPIMKKLVQLKYAGYVGHEFIPTRPAAAGLKQAIQVCDV